MVRFCELPAGFQQLQKGVLYDILRFCSVPCVLNRNAQKCIIIRGHQFFQTERFHPDITSLLFLYRDTLRAGFIPPFTYKTIERAVFVHPFQKKIDNPDCEVL